MRAAKFTWAASTLAVLAIIAFLHLGRPFVLPIFLAAFLAMTVKPVMGWLGVIRIPAPVGAAVVLGCLVALAGFSFVRLSQPAVKWMNDAPVHLTQLRQRANSLFTFGPRLTEAATAVNNLVAAAPEKPPATKSVTLVEVKEPTHNNAWMAWTSTFLQSAVETIILAYLLLAAGDRPLQKLVHVMPTLRDKIRAVDISHEIQRGISDYLFTLSLINLALGLLVATGLYFLGVPNAMMWGVGAMLLNYIPYFGPFVGIVLVGVVGVLTFPMLGKGLLPGLWYLTLHLAETNLVSPFTLGRRLRLNPVMIFISLMFWTWLWGIPGAWLSMPILVATKVVCDRIPSLSNVAELISR